MESGMEAENLESETEIGDSFEVPNTVLKKQLSWSDILNLTRTQKQLVIDTWKTDFDTLYQIGTAIYSYVFTQDPDAIRLFPLDAQVETDWRKSKIFQKQSIRFSRVLSNVVSHLNSPEYLYPMLMRIGYAHQKYRSRGFQAKHWDIFQKAVQVVLTEHIKTNLPNMDTEELNTVMSCWSEVSRFIINVMKEGYYLDEESVQELEDVDNFSC